MFEKINLIPALIACTGFLVCIQIIGITARIITERTEWFAQMINLDCTRVTCRLGLDPW